MRPGKGVRAGWARLVLRVRLRGDEERMDVGGVFHELHQLPVRRGAGKQQARTFRDLLTVLVVDLVTVTVPLRDILGAIQTSNNRSACQLRWIGAKRMVPPKSASPDTAAFCSSIVEMTGVCASGSNSVDDASAKPA